MLKSNDSFTNSGSTNSYRVALALYAHIYLIYIHEAFQCLRFFKPTELEYKDQALRYIILGCVRAEANTSSNKNNKRNQNEVWDLSIIGNKKSDEMI